MPVSGRNAQLSIMTMTLLGLAAPAMAQLDPAEWFSLRPGPPPTQVEVTVFSDRSSDDPEDEASVRLSRERVRLSLPVHVGAQGNWSLGLDATRTRLTGEPRLTPSQAAWPETLWNAGVSLGHQRRLPGGLTAAGTVRLSSAGDQLHSDSASVQMTGFLMFPARGRDAWVAAFNYASDREFLRGIPIPGGGYLLQRGDRITALLGVPFFLDARVAGPLRARVAFLPSRTYSARLVLPAGRHLAAFATLESEIDRARRRERENPKDQLFLAQRLLRAGFELGLGRGFRAEISAGRTLSRTLVEGREFSHRLRSTRRLPNESFALVRLRTTLAGTGPPPGPSR